ncbi:CRISPR-associated protein Cas4 [Streptomyces sp. NPDC002851]
MRRLPGFVAIGDDERPQVARSVQLSSERLSLIATIDLVESADGNTVRLVDYKKGKAPDLPEGAYEPERVQVSAQCLLLREAGYSCDSGILYFACSRTRVEIPLDETLIARTHELIGQVRELAAAPQGPSPLVRTT